MKRCSSWILLPFTSLCRTWAVIILSSWTLDRKKKHACWFKCILKSPGFSSKNKPAGSPHKWFLLCWPCWHRPARRPHPHQLEVCFWITYSVKRHKHCVTGIFHFLRTVPTSLRGAAAWTYKCLFSKYGHPLMSVQVGSNAAKTSSNLWKSTDFVFSAIQAFKGSSHPITSEHSGALWPASVCFLQLSFTFSHQAMTSPWSLLSSL